MGESPLQNNEQYGTLNETEFQFLCEADAPHQLSATVTWIKPENNNNKV